jgi:hypothetical protein
VVQRHIIRTPCVCQDNSCAPGENVLTSLQMATKEFTRDFFIKKGKKGGKTTAQNRTAEQRKEAARKAVQARWAKEKAEK